MARLTGIKPDTLRVWERRYGLGASVKSPTGRRRYTQSDLEHLQVIAALVGDGARIGEIADAPRRTLEVLLEQRGVTQHAALPRSRGQALFVGPALCDWLDRHQGCLSGVDARLMRSTPEVLDIDAVGDWAAEALVVIECRSLCAADIARLQELRDKCGALCVSYEFANRQRLDELGSMGVAAVAFPPEPGELAFTIAQCIASMEASRGEHNLGELVDVRPRRFGRNELAAAANLEKVLTCECPRHLAEMITALGSFEEYSASCSVDNWQDAATHARIYTYTCQARHLLEKALEAALEEHDEDFRRSLDAQKVGDISPGALPGVAGLRAGGP